MREFITAHRFRFGKSSLVENTIEAAKAAIRNEKIQALETDIQLTKDGIFILMNPLTIEKMTELKDETKNKVSDYTYYELSKMSFHANLKEVEDAILSEGKEFGRFKKEYLNYYQRIKNNPHHSRIATLDELLVLPRKDKHLFIEIKTDYSENQSLESTEFAKLLVATLKKFNAENISIIGRDTNTLTKIKQENQSIPCIPVIGIYNGNDNKKLTYGLDGASLVYNHLDLDVPGTNKKAFEYLAEEGGDIAVWNLRTKEEYNYAKEVLIKNNIQNDFYPTGDFVGEFVKTQ